MIYYHFHEVYNDCIYSNKLTGNAYAWLVSFVIFIFCWNIFWHWVITSTEKKYPNKIEAWTQIKVNCRSNKMCWEAGYRCDGCGSEYGLINHTKGEKEWCPCCNKLNSPRYEVSAIILNMWILLGKGSIFWKESNIEIKNMNCFFLFSDLRLKRPVAVWTRALHIVVLKNEIWNIISFIVRRNSQVKATWPRIMHFISKIRKEKKNSQFPRPTLPFFIIELILDCFYQK